MILAVGPRQRPHTLNRPNPDKTAILAAMKSFAPNAAVEGCDVDYKTGKAISDNSGLGYIYGDLLWTSEQIYNFEHYDLVLNPEFCDSVVRIAGQGSSA